MKKQSKDEIRKLYINAGGRVSDNASLLDYSVNRTASIVEVNGRCFPFFNKPIEKDFCHPDEPWDEAVEWMKTARTFDYFKSENMNLVLSRHSQLVSDKPIVMVRSTYDGMWDYDVKSNYVIGETMDECTRQALIEESERHIERTEKRLETWWKKYGADHLHVWTYWRDA